MLQLVRRVVSCFRRDRLDDELAEEIRLHLDLRRRARIENGMSPADADYEARRQFGNVTAIRERSRDHWGSVAVTAVVQDVRFGTRVLARSRGLCIVVVLTIHVLRTPAALGRTFGPAEDRPPLGSAVAVLTDRRW